jgi:hypothetical protein
MTNFPCASITFVQDMLAINDLWIDTKEVRASDSRAFALLNDSERAVSPFVMDALQRVLRRFRP